ncbi:MAG: hypothetical protein QOF89_5632, partial [Acidobacteriota bacterium]|nr:hypothetical protein [Acidobacteriota bacterium]
MASEESGQKVAISPEKLALLVMRLKKKAAETLPAGEIQRRIVDGPPPLSFAQQRLWLLDRLEPGGSAYDIPSPARLTGDLDPGALAWTLAEIRRRHEALRTTFATLDGVPVQVIAPPDPATPVTPAILPLVDLSALPEPAGRGEGERLLAAEAKTPFDLEAGPLCRIALVRLAPAEHLLVLNMHHIVSDGWSMGLFFNELSVLYAAGRDRRPSPLPEPPIQYSDFAVWQREWLRGPALEEQLAYWRGQLAGSPPALELPTDRLRPAVPTHRGEALPLRLPASLTLALRELSRREGASLFMTLLAAFNVLLSRLSGQEDVVVGSPSAGRGRLETEGLIGLFLNTLVLRTDLSGAASFKELLARVSSVVLGAYRYQDVPFEKLLEELQPERVLSRSPFFQVLFNMVSLPDARLAMPGLQVELLDLQEPPDAKFDFTLYLQDRGEVIDVSLVYSSDLFDRARMEELLRQLERVLSQAVAAPGGSLAALSLVTPAAHLLLPDPAAPLGAPLGGDWLGPVHAAAGRWAARTPARPAVLGWREGEVWTYAELDARSNQLAQFLRQGGVQTGDVVALWAHRSASLVWAVLGTLKAGAAIMILDPAYPPARLVDYLRIGRPQAWLSVAGAASPPDEVLDEVNRELPALRLDLPPLPSIPEGFLAGVPATAPGIPIGPDDAACITFTSGSTGRPKAVVGRHGPLSHFYPWMGERFDLSERDRFGMLSALSHDPLQRDLFTPLWFGAALCIPEPDRLGAPRYLAEWIRRQEVSVLHLTPAMMELVTLAAEEAPAGEPDLAELNLPSLRRAFVVGDLLKKAEVARLQRLAPGLTCFNLYGSTETQRAVGYFAVPRPEAPEWAGLGREVLPLGRGMEDVQLLVLNPASRLAGIGELGEIHVRSRHLARGYLGDEGLTAERFLVNPFGREDRQEPGDRIYRTGDLGRYLPDGNVELAGRADFQVKLRGFRIELGEIEGALARVPGVKECVVVVREDLPGDRRLAAYLVAAPAPSARDLHALLARQLPDYMVPSDFVTLPALPLTATGKVDRRALPVPVREEAADAERHEVHPVEELLAGIWADLLGVAGVGRHDNFFALGGHSLLATRMISRVRRVLGVDLPLRAVFEEPTLAGLAALIEEARQGEAGPGLPPLVRVPRGRPLPTSFAQQRLWFLDRLEPGSSAYNLAGAVRLEGSLDVAALAAALGGIVGRHESLRTRFLEEGGEPRQVIAEPAVLSLPLVDLSSLAAGTREEEVHRVARAEARRPYDLACGPLARFALLRLGGQENVLLAGMHHIVSDGWSMGIFVRELGAIYRSEARNEAAALPELPIQYADYASWQRQWLSGEAIADRLAWWKRQLGGAPQVVELPLDRPRPAVQSYRGARAGLTIERELVTRLEATTRRLAVTPFMALLAGFATLLSRYGSQSDVVVGTPIANRGRAELEDLIGFFANTLALHLDLRGDPGFDELARRVREVALGAYGHQDVPFERLVSELQPERDLSHSPVFQVMLALQNLPESNLDLAGLTLSPLELDFGRTQYDLSLFLFPHAGGLLVRLEYARDLFDAGTAERLLGHWRTLLEAAVDEPATRVSRLPLLTAGERAQLTAWDEATHRGHPEGLLHGLFAAQARRTPESLALVAGSLTLTYAELAARSARLAAHLQALGAGPEIGVAVCLERTADLIVTLLAVLRAGAFYVPLDPRYPAERLRFLLEDSGARVLVAKSGLAAELPGPRTRCRRLDLESVPAAVPPSDRALADPGVTAGNLAYLIYTSGSTGRPKAVAIEHRSAVAFASWARESFSADELRGVLASTAVTFDLSVFEVFVTLSWGGTVVLAQNALELPEVAAGLPPGIEVTLINTVPSALAELLRQESLPQSVRTINLAGEALPRWLADRAWARPETGRLCNLYGPSEDTTYSTWTVVERATQRAPSIGRPVHDTRAYVLDPGLERLPVGIAGELCLSGAGLARGYLGRPELTAERFLPDPFAPVADDGAIGTRMYRTGDLVRLRPDGELEYLGRLDHQVKVRGYRIELGEVEAALVRLPGVGSAVVLAREDVPGDRRLVAYVVASGAEPAVAELRQALQQTLPEPMVPSAFVFLEAFPLTPHGKVDRRALPAPGEDRHEAERSRERSPAEELLAGVWSALLRIPMMGPQDDFFELGGHSLLATQVVSRVREVFGVELPLRALFETPTLGGLAARIDRIGEARHQGPGLQAPPIRPLPPALRDGELQASFAQERLWFLDRFGTDRSSYNIPVAVRLRGRLDVPALAACLTEIVRRHESLRTTFTVTGGAEPRVLQVIAPPRELPLPVADLAALPAPEREAEAVRLTREEARRLFDLERGPLVRASLARLGEEEHRLLLSVHHIVSDGWSIGVLVRELSALYSAFVQGRPSPLPELPVQYADFAAWQRDWLQGEVLEAQLGWWRERLAGAPAVIALPADRPRPRVQSARGGRLAYALPAELSQGLKALVRAEGATLFMALLAGFQTLLARTTGGEDL